MALKIKLMPTQGKFVMSDSRYVWLIGPEGSGKSFSGIAALFQHRKKLEPFLLKNSKGQQMPMRGAIIRDTHQTIKRHMIRSIQDDFPDIFTFHDDYHQMIGPGMEIDLFGMQDVGSLNKIQGGAYHIIWLEEPAPILHTGNAGIRHESFLMCARRIRGKAIEINGKMVDAPRRLQVTMNPAEKEHWTYGEAIVNPLTNTSVFQTPKHETKLSEADQVARAEAFRDRPDLAARYDDGKFAEVYPGVKITPEYHEDIHFAKDVLLPIPGAQHFRFWDGGLNPTCIISCLTPGGQFHILDCVSDANVGMRQLLQEKVLPLLARPRYQRIKGKRLWRDIGDASLANREQSDSENRASLIIEGLLHTDFEKGVQLWDPRREAIKDALTRSPGGRPFLQVNPRITEGEPFNRVHAALSGGYSYKVTALGTVLRDGPDKAPVHSHIGDALTHGLARLFFREPKQAVKYNQDKGLKRAAGYGVG